MPMRSEAQRRAMYAAEEGKSTIGIPKTVGADFVAHDQGGQLPMKAPKAPQGPKAPVAPGQRKGRLAEIAGAHMSRRMMGK